MPQRLIASERDLSTLAQLRDLASEVRPAIGDLLSGVDNPYLFACLDGYRSRLQTLAEETAQLLDWLKPETAVQKTSEPPSRAARAKLAASRLKQRCEVAEIRASMQENADRGFPTDASQRELDRMRADRIKLFGEDNYIYGLATSHRLTAAEWREIAAVYRALAAEALLRTKREAVEPEDAARIADLRDRFAKAILPCGHALSHDDDAEWLASLLPAAVIERDDLATMASLTKAIQGARSAPPDAPRPAATSTGADRCRLKAAVARTKALLARAEACGQRDDGASLDIRRLQVRHRLDFHEEGYVFGFSAAHRLEPDDWECLARAYEELANAIERGVESEEDARMGQEAVDRLRMAMIPAGRALRHDDDADDLQASIADRSRAANPITDPLTPFLDRLSKQSAEITAAATLATEILAAGVRPSDPRLREPFLDWTEDLDGPTLEPLVRELRRERERRQAQVDEEDKEPPDPTYIDLRDRVREVTRGKRLLMVGGTNREETRRAIEAELELAELHWPDADERKTKPVSFDVLVDHADLIAKNRFCRRGFQRALTRAKDQGKPAVALLGGYSPRQVVRGIAEALHL